MRENRLIRCRIFFSTRIYKQSSWYFQFFYWLTRNTTLIDLFFIKVRFFQSYENMVCTSVPERFFYWIHNLVCSFWWDYFQLEIRCLVGNFCPNTQYFSEFFSDFNLYERLIFIQILLLFIILLLFDFMKYLSIRI